jgi:hypothetical protein
MDHDETTREASPAHACGPRALSGRVRADGNGARAAEASTQRTVRRRYAALARKLARFVLSGADLAAP